MLVLLAYSLETNLKYILMIFMSCKTPLDGRKSMVLSALPSWMPFLLLALRWCLRLRYDVSATCPSDFVL